MIMPEEMTSPICFVMRQAIDCSQELTHKAGTMEGLHAHIPVEDDFVKPTNENTT